MGARTFMMSEPSRTLHHGVPSCVLKSWGHHPPLSAGVPAKDLSGPWGLVEPRGSILEPRFWAGCKPPALAF